MNELFRFMTVRGPQAANADANIPLTGSQGTTPFQDALRPLCGTPGVFEAMANLARQFEAGPDFVDPITDLTYGPALEKLYRWLVLLPTLPVPPPEYPEQDTSILARIAAKLVQIFDQSANSLAESQVFAQTHDHIHDSLVALFLAPATGRRPAQPVLPPLFPPLDHAVAMAPLAAIARALDVVLRVASGDTTLNDPGAVEAALRRTLLLPPTIFPLLPEPRIRPAGIADLRVVRQHLARYEGGEISDIQNLLAGEARAHTNKHSLTVEQTVVNETEKTTETSKDLSTKERFALQQEVERTLKEETNVSAGLSISAKFGKTVALDTNVDVAYAKSKDSSAKSATSFAKEVTRRAASKVTERLLTQQIAHTVETFLDQQDHGFDNSVGITNVQGVYQWLNKVYAAQVFNYGKRLLFDISVPEPAAFLLSTGYVAASAKRPVPPIAFTANGVDGPPLVPNDLAPFAAMPNYYLKIAARYGIDSIAALPAGEIVRSLVLSPTDGTPDDKLNLIVKSLDTMDIPPGYQPVRLRVNGSSTPKASLNKPLGGADHIVGSSIVLYVGSVAFNFQQGPNLHDFQNPVTDATFVGNTVHQGPGGVLAETGKIALALSTQNIQGLSLTVELVCQATAKAREIWQLAIYDTIHRAYQQQLADYRERLTEFLDFEQGDSNGASTLGGSPDHNRAIERRELKKGALDVLAAKNIVDMQRGAVKVGGPGAGARNFPRVDLVKYEQEAALARFFEQAFEWEEMTYFFYPYYWSRLSRWYDKAALNHDDPLFLEFLKAGAARVVVPVRPGFEEDVQYYLMTGQVWGGGDLPGLTDSDYLPISEEIRAISGAPGDEKPEGEPWEVILPTQLVKLRPDGELPAWHMESPGDWSTWTPDDAVLI